MQLASGVDQFSLVIQTSFLGDVVLTTPLLAELATRICPEILRTPFHAGQAAPVCTPACICTITVPERTASRTCVASGIGCHRARIGDWLDWTDRD